MNVCHASLLWGFWGIAFAAAAQESVSPSVVASGHGVAHVVQSGETLFGLARRYRVTVGDLEAANGLRPGNILRVGTSLRIPGAAAASTPNPVTPTSGPAPAAAAASGNITHVVKPGETLGRVAKAYGLTPEDLARANGISDPNRIRVGQRLNVFAPGQVSAPAPVAAVASAPPAVESARAEPPPKAVAAPTPTPSVEKVGNVQPEETYHYYDVQPNDTLSAVATMFFTTAEEVARLNNIQASALLKAGQQLVVPTRRYFEELRRQGDMG